MDTNQNTAAKIAAAKKALSQLEYQLFQESRGTKKSAAKTTKEMRAEKYKTINGLTIHNLRQAGNTVKITHIRYANMTGVGVLVPIPSYLRKLTDFHPRGGATYVVITTPSKEVYSAVSVCNEVDCFDYRTGVKLALDRFSQGIADELLAPLEAIKADEAVNATPEIVEPTPCPLTGVVPEHTKSCMV